MSEIHNLLTPGRKGTLETIEEIYQRREEFEHLVVVAVKKEGDIFMMCSSGNRKSTLVWMIEELRFFVQHSLFGGQ